LKPLIQNLTDVDLTDIGKTVLELSKIHGDVFKICLPGNKPLILLTNADDIKHLFLQHSDYDKGELYKIFDYHTVGGPKSIDALPHKEWKPLRQVMNKAFSKGRIESLFGVIKDKTEKFILAKIREANGKPVNLDNAFNYWSMEIMAKFAFDYDHGKDFADSAQYTLNYYYNQLAHAAFIHPWKRWPFNLSSSAQKLNQARDNIMTRMNKIVMEKKEEGTREDSKDVLSLLLSAEGSDKIDTQTLVETCYFMLIAGDTTPTAITSFLYYMCANPEIQKKN